MKINPLPISAAALAFTVLSSCDLITPETITALSSEYDKYQEREYVQEQARYQNYLDRREEKRARETNPASGFTSPTYPPSTYPAPSFTQPTYPPSAFAPPTYAPSPSPYGGTY